jgi:hypothetical protein
MRLISGTRIASRRISHPLSIGSRSYPKLANRSIPVPACRWVATGDARLPLVCLWRAVADDTEEFASSEGSTEAPIELFRCA